MLSPSITCLNDDVRDAPVDHQAGGSEAGQSKAGKQRRAGGRFIRETIKFRLQE